MRRETILGWTVLVAAMPIFCMAPARRADGRNRSAPAGIEATDRRADVQWGKDWQDTLDSNSARWKEQLAREAPNAHVRESRLRFRQVRLLEAMLARYQPAGADTSAQ